MARTVFISYASPDEAFVVGKLLPVLQSAGLGHWEMSDSISGGAAWQQEVCAGIDACEAIVVVVSEAGARSEWVATEATLAGNARKTIVPIRIDQTPPEAIYAPLVRVQHIDALPGSGDWAARLVRALREDAAGSTGSVEVAPPPRRRRPYALAVLLGLVVAVLGAGVLALALGFGRGGAETDPPRVSASERDPQPEVPEARAGAEAPTEPEATEAPTPPSGPPVPRARLPGESEAASYARLGKWDMAEAHYAEQNAGSPLDLDPFCGLAEVRIRMAVNLAQRAKLEEGIAALDKTVGWLETTIAGFPEDPVTTRQIRGYASTYITESCVNRMKWCRILGDEASFQANRKKAATHADLALQYLDRDGVNHWNLLIRRAEMHRVNGDLEAYLKDLRIATLIDSDLVPPHVWMAHATGCRRITEEALRIPGGEDVAREWAKTSQTILRKAESWSRQRGDGLTRSDWIEAIRGYWTASRVLLENALPNHGMLVWYAQNLKALPPPAYEPAEKTQAVGLVVEAAVLHIRGEPRSALPLAKEAARLREELEREGGEAADPWTFEVLAAIQAKLTYEARAKASLARAELARRRHPE